MDHQHYEWVRFPFEESHVRHRGGQTIPPNGVGNAYQQLIRVGREIVARHLPNDHLNNLYGTLGKAIDTHTRQGLTELASLRVPILYTEAITEFSARINGSEPPLDSDQLRRLGVALFSAIYVECADLPLGIDFQNSTSSAALTADVGSYAALKAFAETKSRTESDLALITTRTEERVQSLVGTAQSQLQGMIERNSTLQKQDTHLRAQIQQTIGDLKIDVEQLGETATAAKVVFDEVLKQSKENEARISLSRENIQRYADAVREELQIDTTKKLWKSRAQWSAASFWLSAGVIFAALAAPIHAAYTNMDGIIEILRHIGDAATQGLPADATTAQLTTATISRLVIITVPLAIYFWAIKLLVRFNARSMILMDDARQRETMMDVYFHLIEKNGATSEERALVLNALFRPAPGHGPENVDPPNFTELLNKAAAGKS
ncbi:hypothetical protein ILFOPFJJ_00968 [Ensifer psoraleae]|nr:hypothetical protein [Sinorhizobium psoraleae]